MTAGFPTLCLLFGLHIWKWGKGTIFYHIIFRALAYVVTFIDSLNKKNMSLLYFKPSVCQIRVCKTFFDTFNRFILNTKNITKEKDKTQPAY